MGRRVGRRRLRGRVHCLQHHLLELIPHVRVGGSHSHSTSHLPRERARVSEGRIYEQTDRQTDRDRVHV